MSLKEVKTNPSEIIPREDLEKYNFMNLVRHLADPAKPQYVDAAGFELEVSKTLQQELRRYARGAMVPGEIFQRAMSTTSFAAGGALVTEQLSSNIIESLENASVVRALGATVISGLIGDFTIPKQTGGATAYWIGEGDDITESQPEFGQVALRPKGVGTWFDITRRFSQQTSPAVGSFLLKELDRRIKLAVDLAAINGAGANGEPLGLLKTTGIGAVTLATTNTPTFGEVVDIESELAVDNALGGSLAYTSNATIAGKMKQTDKGSDTGKYVLEDGKVNGHRYLMSNQVPAKYLLYGNWSDLIIGEWSGIDVNVDTASLSKSGGLRIVAIQDTDVAVRHPESFAYGYKA